MTDVILLIAVTGTFIFGYFLMCRIDKFIGKSKKAKEEEDFAKENDSASCVMLTGDLADEEITREVKQFIKDHENTRIMLFEADSDTSSSNPKK